MVDMEGSLPESPWDSLDKIEAGLVSETKLIIYLVNLI